VGLPLEKAPFLWDYGTVKKLLSMQNTTTGAEARTDSGALRGAEAPLFHGNASS
jgi:hypothetical protein